MRLNAPPPPPSPPPAGGVGGENEPETAAPGGGRRTFCEEAGRATASTRTSARRNARPPRRGHVVAGVAGAMEGSGGQRRGRGEVLRAGRGEVVRCACDDDGDGIQKQWRDGGRRELETTCARGEERVTWEQSSRDRPERSFHNFI